MQVPSGLDKLGPECPGAPKMVAENSLAQWGGAGAEVWMKAEGRGREMVGWEREEKGERQWEPHQVEK